MNKRNDGMSGHVNMMNGMGHNNLEDAGIYLLMEDITVDSCKGAIQFILERNLDKKSLKQLKLIINSPGGDLSSCFALIDTMKGSKIPVHTVGLGLIASCGLLLFITGEKGHRVLTPNTSILSHQYSWGGWGKEHELFALKKEWDLTTERMVDHYKKCTDMKEQDIRDILLPPEDVWMSAKEAKKYGIADVIKTVY
jgi:ATP-dependent Clp protease protease subunit|tara:strand:- start:94 stop:681 length:588 start_codon:yes stop_codon:yes gene_type:complete